MKTGKQIKYSGVFMAIGLLVSIVINITLLSRLDQVQNQVNSISEYQYEIINNVNDQTSQIQMAMDEIQREQSWISAINMDLNTEELKDGEAVANFDWQIKELSNNSQVVFNYRLGENENYTAISAEELEKGLFRAKVPIEIDLKPQWDIGLYTDSGQEMSKAELEEQIAEEQSPYDFQYFVSMSNDDVIKSGEVHTENLGYFGTSYYGFLQADVHMEKGNPIISLTSHSGEVSSIYVEEAYLQKYQNQTLIGEQEFESDDLHNSSDIGYKIFNLNEVEQYEDMRFVIKVIYNDGETFEKEVY
ncbi:hypothetical protein [Aquibacillus rhizosphaerae]|uniref:Uncharacterized protein n=1 Tax=Aquibacillus rhizosphaerae TaxID=3051431 RepID=A0ABT7LBI5_9BACI|nr:hypothetical protein [Aquibacillus sp. LR5S19]MDL4843228.1 hypothetical protein [Aquibacillus sp. LR5S19]